MIEPVLKMSASNEPLLVYEGFLEIKNNSESTVLDGKLQYTWFPFPALRLNGNVVSPNGEIPYQFFGKCCALIIDGNKIGNILLTEFRTKNGIIWLSGVTDGDAILGDVSVEANELHFDITNLKDFLGDSVKVKNLNQNIRLKFQDSNYRVTIDKILNYDKLYKSLKVSGGYITLYSGRIMRKIGYFTIDEIIGTIKRLSNLLSFVNGNKVEPHIVVGKLNTKKSWFFFPSVSIDDYRLTNSWSPFKLDNLGEMWNQFNEIQEDEDYSDVWNSALNWYIAANRNYIHVEGSIVMIQNALELLFNYIIVEKKGILLEDDSEKLFASSKIRLLLNQFNSSYEIPRIFSKLKAYADKLQKDGPGIFTEIRNSLVHAKKKHRVKLKTAQAETRWQAKVLGLWYLELALLYLLEYRGIYRDRCESKEKLVPWNI